MKLSNSLKDNINNNSIGTNLTLFAVSLFNGTVPTLPSDVVTGSLLCKFTVNGDGVTGGTWGTSSAGVIARAVAEAMIGTCIVAGSPTFYRIHKLSESPSTANTTYLRIQGTCGIASADAILDSTFFPMTLAQDYPLGNVVFVCPTGV